MSEPQVRVGVVGGTGPAGSAIAVRLAERGLEVLLGSRDGQRAHARVAELSTRWGKRISGLRPATNEQAGSGGDVVFLATNWESTVDTTRQLATTLATKVVVSMASAVFRHDSGFECIVPDAGSLAVQVQQAAPRARVVAALQHVPAGRLGNLDVRMAGDVLVAGDDPAAVAVVCDLVALIPDLRAVAAGPLANAAGLEALTAVLLTVNSRERTHATLQLLEA